ncbi:MAG: nicotinate (nicotinamide) nucleotide adenylyltransferase [Desulfovibrionaceae bacterium]|nr:nicotinate (nicotinamide) nucleotide adenylyltransferase [Desulfovibrionaceae bacterium]
MQLGIFGGSFNPFHNGHLAALNAFRTHLNLDRVLLVPTCRSFYKDGCAMASFDERLAMCRAAVRDLPWAEVSDVERAAPRGMCTCDMLARIRNEHPNAKLFFLLGSDVYPRVPLWVGLERIAALAELGVMLRQEESEAPSAGSAAETFVPAGACAPAAGGADIPEDLAGTAALLRARGLATHFVPMGPAVSSTEVRKRLRQGMSAADLVPAAVLDLLRRRGLYTHDTEEDRQTLLTGPELARHYLARLACPPQVRPRPA